MMIGFRNPKELSVDIILRFACESNTVSLIRVSRL